MSYSLYARLNCYIAHALTPWRGAMDELGLLPNSAPIPHHDADRAGWDMICAFLLIVARNGMPTPGFYYAIERHIIPSIRQADEVLFAPDDPDPLLNKICRWLSNRIKRTRPFAFLTHSALLRPCNDDTFHIRKNAIPFIEAWMRFPLRTTPHPELIQYLNEVEEGYSENEVDFQRIEGQAVFFPLADALHYFGIEEEAVGVRTDKLKLHYSTVRDFLRTRDKRCYVRKCLIDGTRWLLMPMESYRLFEGYLEYFTESLSLYELWQMTMRQYSETRVLQALKEIKKRDGVDYSITAPGLKRRWEKEAVSALRRWKEKTRRRL